MCTFIIVQIGQKITEDYGGGGGGPEGPQKGERNIWMFPTILAFIVN